MDQNLEGIERRFVFRSPGRGFADVRSSLPVIVSEHRRPLWSWERLGPRLSPRIHPCVIECQEDAAWSFPHIFSPLDPGSVFATPGPAPSLLSQQPSSHETDGRKKSPELHPWVKTQDFKFPQG